MDEPDDIAGEFVFRPPVWVLTYEPTFRTHGLPAGVAKVDSERGPILLLFTDDDRGQRYLAANGQADRGIRPMLDWPAVVTLLRLMKTRGVGYVGFDCPAAGSPGSGAFYPLNVILAVAERAGLS